MRSRRGRRRFQRAPDPRLGIAQYGWWNALHGVSRLQYNNNQNATTLINTTSYLIDQSLGASWTRRDLQV
jgi:beta-glucosidase